MKPLVSVIVPALNEEERIGTAIEALLAQDHSPLEIFIVDNGSTDRTAHVARSYKGVTVLHEPNKGTMWACERARKEARGEIIVRMDADCLPHKSWISRGIMPFADERTVIVSGPYDYHDGGRAFRAISNAFQKNVYVVSNAILNAFRRGGVVIGGNSFMHAGALEKAGGFNTDIIFWGDDTDVGRRLAVYGRCHFDPELHLPTSARRFKKQGILSLTVTYCFHFFKQVFK